MKRSDGVYRLIIVVLLMVIGLLVQDNRRKDSELVSMVATLTIPVQPSPTVILSVATMTAVPSMTHSATASVPLSPTVTLVPMATTKPLATETPNIAVTPISDATLYDVIGTVNALGCPDSRCKVIDVYKKRSIVVVTGTVMGTTYKKEKTRLWYQVVFHDGRKVYVHGAFLTPHVKAVLRPVTATPTP